MSRPRRIAPGVELFPALTPTLPPATHTNSYAVGDADVLLVEPATPFEDEQREWLLWARSFASQGRRVVGVLLTHHHADHVGGAALFSTELGLPLLAHRETAARLPKLDISKHLGDGDTITLAGPSPMKLRVLHTPGHAPGHLCLLDEDAGTVIVGDMVASVGTILIEPDGGDMQVYLDQLERLARLSAHVALPAHGEPIDDPTALFRRYITHRLAREAKVVAALLASPSRQGDLDTLLPLAYADTPVFLFPLARMSLEAHLIKLVREGKVLQTGAGVFRMVRAS